MRLSLEKELQILKSLILDMAKLVHDVLSTTLLCVEKYNKDIAQKIIEADEQIDYYDSTVCQTALEIIALQQPVAQDLRFIITAIDISKNLERIGDQCVNIAEYLTNIAEKKGVISCEVPINKMANEAFYMLECAINAFIKEDKNEAKKVIEYDNIVDKLEKEIIEKTMELMKKNSEFINAGVNCAMIAYNLERIADQATNIAEGVIFTIEGVNPKFVYKKPEEVKELREIVFKEIPVFELLKKHAHLVIECMERVPLALEAYYRKDKNKFEEVFKDILEIEREADKLKVKIRNELPLGLVLPVEKFKIFFYLREQDSIADMAERILNWLSFKDIEIPKEIFTKLLDLLNQNIETAKRLEDMISYSENFLITRNETEREKAKEIIRKIRYNQHIAENTGNDLKREIFQTINDPITLFFLLDLVDYVMGISSHTENSADLMRAMIAK